MKAGNIGYFPDFFNQAILWNRLFYDSYFDKWRGHGSVSLCARPMTADLRAAGIELDMLDLLSLTAVASEFASGLRVNVGLSPEEVYALLFAKFRADYAGRRLDRATCTAIREQVSAITDEPRRFQGLTPHLVDRCERIHRDDNARFMSRLGLPAWETAFSPDIAAAGQSQTILISPDKHAEIEHIVEGILNAAPESAAA